MLISRGAEEMEASEKTRTSKEMQTPWTDSDGTPYNRLTNDRAGCRFMGSSQDNYLIANPHALTGGMQDRP